MKESADIEFSELWFSCIENIIDFSKFNLWESFMRSPIVTPQIVKRYINSFPIIKNYYERLAENPNFTLEDIKEILSLDASVDEKRYYNCILSHPDVKWDFIKELISSPKLKDLNFNFLSINPNITWENIQESISINPEIKKLWNYSYLSSNPNIPWEVIENDLKLINHFPWDFFELSVRKDISLKFVAEHSEFFWDYTEISANLDITWENIKSVLHINPNFPWDFYHLSYNKNLTWENIQESFSLGYSRLWDYVGLSTNPNILKDNLLSQVILGETDFPVNYTGLSANPNITWEIVKANLHLPWNFDWLSGNPNITWENVQESISMNPKLENKWSYNSLSARPNITLDIVKENLESSKPKKWNILKLLYNPGFVKEPIKVFDFLKDMINKLKVKNYVWLVIGSLKDINQAFVKQRNQKRCALIKEELMHKTGQPGYFFKNCLSDFDKKELGFDEAFLREADAKYPVKF